MRGSSIFINLLIKNLTILRQKKYVNIELGCYIYFNKLILQPCNNKLMLGIVQG